jgi:hypothetical protein
MILHFSHMGLTEGRTFTLAFALVVRFPGYSFGTALATGTVAATASRSASHRKLCAYERNVGC